MKLHNHGDIILKPVAKIKPVKPDSQKIHILQSSGTTGNRHEVVSKKSLIHRFTKNDVEYIQCDEDFIIQHIGGDCEHGTQNVKAGTYQILHEEEYDPWKNELKRVIDQANNHRDIIGGWLLPGGGVVGISGNVDRCEITDEDREKGIDIQDLIT